MQATNAISKDLTVNINTFLVRPQITVKLRQYDPDCGKKQPRKMEQAEIELSELSNHMSHLQYKLFADRSKALLVILQGVDTSGKDGTIRHVMEAFNPQSPELFHLKHRQQRRLPMITFGEYIKHCLPKVRLQFSTVHITKIL